MSRSDASELASLASTVAEVESRVAAIAAQYDGTDHEAIIAALYEAERLLRSAQRAVVAAGRAVP